ncbi:MAG: hypothetical protein ACYCVW_16520 [Rhodocyclaceae bacterium]
MTACRAALPSSIDRTRASGHAVGLIWTPIQRLDVTINGILLSGANDLRRGLIIQNNNPGYTLWLNLFKPAITSGGPGSGSTELFEGKGLYLPPMTLFQWIGDDCSQDAIYIAVDGFVSFTEPAPVIFTEGSIR